MTKSCDVERVAARVRVIICGARGSTPSPGPEFERYGGHTSCVAVAHNGRTSSLVLDAGTGLRLLPGVLGDRAFDGSILLGHLHWDHTQGLPFCPAVDRDDARTDLYIPEQGDSEKVLERFMSPPHFPITPSQLRGRWSFIGLEAGTHSIEGFTVMAADIPHKGGRSFGYRVTDDSGTVAYLSDHCPTVLGPGPAGLGELHEAAMALAAGADLLIHDAQNTDAELPAKADFGHASVGYATALAEAAGVKKLVLFHHDPRRSDDAIDAMAAAQATSLVPVTAAGEGSVYEIG